MTIVTSQWERDGEISRLVSLDKKVNSRYLSDIRAWEITEQGTAMSSIAREKDVVAWAEERGIFEKSNPAGQHSKTLEEVQELTDALEAGDEYETKDAIGDITVTLILQAKLHGWTLGECLEQAYNEIKDRKGKMVDGVFVKE